MVSFPQKEHYDLADFRQVIEILRHPGGCPWDQEQTHQSIRRNLLEEAYEAAEAIDTENTTLLQEELGDVLMQVLFHSSIEADAGRFDLDDVADMAVKKLISPCVRLGGRGGQLRGAGELGRSQAPGEASGELHGHVGRSGSFPASPMAGGESAEKGVQGPF